MGAAGSKLEKALGDQFPEGERYFGLENFGNTCYCNSVLQVSSSSVKLCHFISKLLKLGFFILSVCIILWYNENDIKCLQIMSCDCF